MKLCLFVIILSFVIGTKICSAKNELNSEAINEALQARNQGLPQVAIVKLSQLLATSHSLNESQKIRVLQELGRTYLEAGRLGDAIHILRLQRLASDSAARFWLAQSLAVQGEYTQALAIYREVLTNINLRPYASLGIVSMLHALGKPIEALAAITNISSSDRSVIGVPIVLEQVNILLDLNRIEDAAAVLKAHPEVATSAWGRYLSARIAMFEGRWDFAATILEDIKPENNELIRNIFLARAECLIQSGDLSSAENILRKFIQENPQHSALPIVFAKLNEVYNRGNSPSSIDLRRWIEDTDHPFRADYARFYYACNDLRISHTESAVALFRAFIQDLPRHPLANAARIEMAQQYLILNKAQNALDVLAGIQANLPDAKEIEKDANFLRGRALFSLNRYTEAADTFLKAAQHDSLPQAEATLYNAALSYLLANRANTNNPAQRELMRRFPNGSALQELRLVDALKQAKQKYPNAAKAVEALAATSPRARLALAEIKLVANDRQHASQQWDQLANNHLAVGNSDRTAYLAIFLADNGDEKAEDRVIRLARNFLDAFPNSSFRDEVRMKLGEAFFRRENFLEARIQFESLAREFPDSPLFEPALFFAGQSSVRMMDPSGIENAMLIFEEVAKMGGPFALRARLEQAQLQEMAGQPDQSLLILKNILSSKPGIDIRFEALMMQGNIFFSQGLTSSENYDKAIKSWQQIVSDPNVTLPWRNQALTKIGAAYQKLGDFDKALASYYDVFSTFDSAHPEFFWFYKAGFDAGKLLESKQLWKEAANVYKQIASIPGPRSQEAQDRMKRLKSENLIE